MYTFGMRMRCPGLVPRMRVCLLLYVLARTQNWQTNKHVRFWHVRAAVCAHPVTHTVHTHTQTYSQVCSHTIQEQTSQEAQPTIIPHPPEDILPTQDTQMTQDTKPRSKVRKFLATSLASFLSGAAAGLVCDFLMWPVETVKTRLQVCTHACIRVCVCVCVFF